MRYRVSSMLHRILIKVLNLNLTGLLDVTFSLQEMNEGKVKQPDKSRFGDILLAYSFHKRLSKKIK